MRQDRSENPRTSAIEMSRQNFVVIAAKAAAVGKGMKLRAKKRPDQIREVEGEEVTEKGDGKARKRPDDSWRLVANETRRELEKKAPVIPANLVK